MVAVADMASGRWNTTLAHYFVRIFVSILFLFEYHIFSMCMCMLIDAFSRSKGLQKIQ